MLVFEAKTRVGFAMARDGLLPAWPRPRCTTRSSGRRTVFTAHHDGRRRGRDRGVRAAERRSPSW